MKGESQDERDDRLYAYREAELKHGRLAHARGRGLAAQRLRRPALDAVGDAAELVNVDDSGVGLAPSLLNGGLGQVATGYWGVALFLGAYWEGIGVRRLKGRAREGQKRAPGDLGFDPLGVVARQERTRTTKAHARAGADHMGARRCSQSSALDPGVPHEGAGRRGDAAVLRAARGRRAAFFPHVGENFFLRKDVEGRFLPVRVGEILGFAHGAPLKSRRIESNISMCIFFFFFPGGPSRPPRSGVRPGRMAVTPATRSPGGILRPGPSEAATFGVPQLCDWTTETTAARRIRACGCEQALTAAALGPDTALQRFVRADCKLT